MTTEKTLEQIAFLEKTLAVRDSKYRRNFNRYVSNGFRREDIYNLYGNPLGWSFTQSDADTGIIPNINVSRSCIQTSISKLSQTKVRPLFTPVQGLYETEKVCKSAQIFFDEFFDAQEIYRKAILTVRDAEIFEYGAVWIDEETNTIKRIRPWEFYFDPADLNFGKITQCLIRLRSYPAVYLKDKFKKGTRPAEMLAEFFNLKGEYRIHYNFIDKVKMEFFGQDKISETKIEYDCPPVVPFFYEEPIRGAFSTSMMDNLYSLQVQVDSVSQKIHDAIELSPANSIFVQKGANVKASMVTNQIGQVFEVSPAPNGGLAMNVATPPPIDPMYINLLEMYKKQMYEMEGISELSAQSKKPSGLNSGVALDTLQDVESERHNVLLQDYIQFLMKIAKVVIEVFPETADILPESRARANGIKWKDVKKQRALYNIQFSSSSSLSKDPKTKMEQLEKLIAMKVIPADMIPKFLDMPDLDGAYSIVAAAFDDNEKIIERAIELEQYDFYEVTNLMGLYQQTVNRLLRLDANGEKDLYKVRLVTLIQKIKEVMDTIGEETAPPPPQGPQAPPVDVQAQAMNGAQIQGLGQIIAMIKTGQLSQESVAGIISLALPGVDPAMVNQIVQSNTPVNTGVVYKGE